MMEMDEPATPLEPLQLWKKPQKGHDWAGTFS